jgi:hypothetical protein
MNSFAEIFAPPPGETMHAQRHLSQFACSKPIWKILLLGCVVTLTMSTLAAPAFAQPGRRYTPPSDRSAPSSTIAGGARSGGCTGGENTSFTALAPLSHIGRTSATRPTFSWYVPKSPAGETALQGTTRPIDFRLYVYGADGKLQPRPIYQNEIPSQPGIMSFVLPSSQPELTVGQRYYWRAALICDPNHGSEDLIVSAEMSIVENTSPESERWYDLLQAALNGNSSPSRSIDDLLTELAELERTAGEALAQSSGTAAEGNRLNLQQQSQEILQHSEHLSQIIKAEP